MIEKGKVRNISHIHLNCSDFKRSVAFYELLGFQVDRIIRGNFDERVDHKDMDTVPLVQQAEGKNYCVGLGLGDDPRATTRLELMQWTEPSKTLVTVAPKDRLGIVRVAFTVKDLNCILERLTANGVAVENTETFDVSPDLESLFAHLYDPDGNWLTLMEWIKH